MAAMPHVRAGLRRAAPRYCLGFLLAVASLGCSADVDEPAATAQPPAQSPTATPLATVQAPDQVAAGKRLLEQGDYEQAVEEFTRALEAAHQSDALFNPGAEEAEVYYQRGIAYLKMGFPDNAMLDFTDAIDLRPENGKAYEHRARAYFQLGDQYKSLSDSSHAIRLLTDNAAAYHLRGQIYLRRRQYDRSIADLELAARQEPALAAAANRLLAEAYFKWSEELAEADEHAASAEKLATARELNPAYVDGQLALAAEPEPVERTAARPVVVEEEADKRFAAGLEHQQAQRYDQALIEYTKAISLRAGFEQAYMRRGETLLAMGFADTALEDLKRATRRNHGSAEAYQLQTKAYLALESPHRAVLAATEALHVDPTRADSYVLRGQAYVALEVWDRAIADLEEAVRRDPALKAELQASLAAARRGQTEASKRAPVTAASRGL